MKTPHSEHRNNLIEWTGVPPTPGICPGVRPDGKMTSLPLVSLSADRQQILNYLNNTWTLTEMLFSGLANEEAFSVRPYHHLRHPLIFYFGHPAVFYVNKLRVAGLLSEPVNSDYERIFETGVDEMSWDDLYEGQNHIWPTVQDILAYRKKVYQIVCELIKTHPLLDSKASPVSQTSPMWALFMSFEHERIHFETSSVLIRELPIEFVQKPAPWPNSQIKNPNSPPSLNKMIAQPESQIHLGKPQDLPTFGWDNEYGHEIRNCSAFSASQFLISNGEFKIFVEAGAYSDEKFWQPEGWAWRSFRNIKHPSFWVSTGPAGLHEYKLRTVFEVIEMEWDWPVCVNFHEAKAYCAWLTKQEGSLTPPYRLLFEVEHHALRDDSGKDFNLNFNTGSESSVHSHQPNDKGFYDTFGNVWQWCEDYFHPLPGSTPHPYYEDFSTPCFDKKHQMLLGGSFISTGDEASHWARFQFRPHFFQHAGFRVARGNQKNAQTVPGKSGPALYESQEMVNKYMLMHWGTDDEILSEVPDVPRPAVVHLPKICAELILKYSSGFDKALDLGCAVGRSSFEMSRHFKQVLGIDYSHEFIDCANQLKNMGQLSYWRKDTGSKGAQLRALVDPDIDISRLHFEQGDACSLSPEIKDFDAVLLANVLCRLPKPSICLERMQGINALVKPGGVLVMTTPLSWLEEYTMKAHWLNGLQDIQKILSEFDLIHQQELPFLIREHHRKFEYIVTQASVWRRKKG